MKTLISYVMAKNDGTTKEDIEDFVSSIVYMIRILANQLDSQLKADKKLYDRIQKARHYYEVYLSGFRMIVNPALAFLDKAKEISLETSNNLLYRSLLKELHNYFLRGVGIDFEEFICLFSKWYIVENTPLDEIANKIKDNIIKTEDRCIIIDKLNTKEFPEIILRCIEVASINIVEENKENEE